VELRFSTVSKMSGFEVAGVVLGALPLIISATENYAGELRRRRQLDWSPIRPQTTAKCYLRVWDFSRVEDLSPQVVRTTDDLTKLKSDLGSLQEQQENTFRVYLIEGSLANNSDLLAHLHARGIPSGLSPSNDRGNMFEALANQWRGSESMCYELNIYSFEEVATMDREKYNRVNGGLAFLAGLIRMNMSIQIIDVAGERDKSISMALPSFTSVVLTFLLVIISCQALASPIRGNFMENIYKVQGRSKLMDNQWNTVIGQLERFSRHLLRSNDLYKGTARPLTSPESLKQLFPLRYYSAILNHYSLFLNSVQREYVEVRESMMDPRYSILRPSIMKEITADAYIYEEFQNIALDITDPVANLITILGSAFPDANQCQEFRAFAAELRCQCTDIMKTASRFSSRLDLHLKFLEVSRNVHESLRVWILSVLASIFLPLSVATGILSMQSRFIKLDLLLYDFCGIVVLLGTILFMVFRLVQRYIVLKEMWEMWRPKSIFTRLAKSFVGYSAPASVSYIWGLLLASFLVGMIKDSGLGGRILGFGLGALAGISVLAAAAFYCALRWIS
jgi:hypothetical protein